MSRTVLGVGHCGYDNGRMECVIQKLGGVYEAVNDAAQALTRIRQGDVSLVLPNRVIDGEQAGGLAIIQAIRAEPELSETKAMLISGFPDKQTEAVAAGAQPGFGKDRLETPEVAELLRAVLE